MKPNNSRSTICVTVLVENSVTGRGLRAEHGLAYHVQAGRHALLFDTGQSDLLIHNARELGLRLEEIEAGRSVVRTTRPTELLDGICVTGEIPREASFEDNGGAFFLDEACARRDPLVDDQALYFDTRFGVVVLLGCAHAGVVNTLNTIRAITGGRPIHSVIGGMHLLEASAARVLVVREGKPWPR